MVDILKQRRERLYGISPLPEIFTCLNLGNVHVPAINLFVAGIFIALFKNNDISLKKSFQIECVTGCDQPPSHHVLDCQC